MAQRVDDGEAEFGSLNVTLIVIEAEARGNVRNRWRTEITIETDEVFIIRQSGRVIEGWCRECAEVVEMITPDEAVIASGLSARALYRRIEEGRLHYTETDEGFLLICLKSLSGKLIAERVASRP